MLNNIIESWKEVTRLHEVSNKGNIRNTLTKKGLKPWVGTTGYYHIKILVNGKKKNLKLHRLIAIAFIPNPENKKYVNHKDGNKLNNTVTNLEWCTHKENMEHASSTKLLSKKPRTIGKKLGKRSQYYNVSWDSSRNQWSAGITINKKSVMRKRFNCEIEAAKHVNHIIDTLGLIDRPRNNV